MAAPVPKQNQLLGQIAALANSSVLNEIALRRVEDEARFSIEGARTVLELAREMLRNKGVRVTEYVTVLQPDDDTFLWSCEVLASPESAAELNEELADRIAAQDDLLEDPGFRFIVMFDGTS